VSVPGHAAIRMAAAIGATGDDGPVHLGAPDAGEAEPVGRRLLRLIFGVQGGAELPEPVADLAAAPSDPAVFARFEYQVHLVLEASPEVKAVATEMLTRFYTVEASVGNVQALVELGHLLWWDDPGRARAAFEAAIEAGAPRGLLDLALLLDAVLGDEAAARGVFQEAIGSADPDVAAEALVEFGHLLLSRRDPGALAVFERAIATGHREFAPAAMIGAGLVRDKVLGDYQGALAAFQRAAGSGTVQWAAQALIDLGDLLDRHGDTSGAADAWRRAATSGVGEWASMALNKLANLAHHNDDLDMANAAHRIAAEAGSPEASYILLITGHILASRGDTARAREAYRQAIDSGYTDDDEWVLEFLQSAGHSDQP
jgi:predicted negative regulator of RcsB-dependent stress response